MATEGKEVEAAAGGATSPDVERLRDWLVAKIRSRAFGDIVTVVITLVVRLRDLNTELTRKLVELRRARPRSERLRAVEGQLSLGLDLGVPSSPAPVVANGDAPPGDRPARRTGGRKRPPKDWPRVIIENPVPTELRRCPTCGREMKPVGYQKCEKVELRPAEVFIEERRDERIACPHDDTIVSAPTPPEIVERGALGTVLITEAACDKFLEHLPIERQCRRFLRARVNVSPRTLGRAVCALADLCEPVAKAIHEETRRSAILSTDATGLPVLDRDHPDHIRTGSVWTCIGDTRWVSFLYAPSGEAAHIEAFLGEERGRVVQCDGTATLNFVERMGGKRPGCWAHARRRFVAALRAGDTLAGEPLHIIARLFAIERVCDEAHDDARVRHERRRLLAPDVLAELRAWLDRYRGLIPPKTPLGKALGYLHRQWSRLVLFLEDGRIELTNNRAERELRRLVLGRKNWLFAMNDIGGERAATMLTIFGTCISQGIRPRQYLHELVKRLLAGWPQARLRELLPDSMLRDVPELSALPNPSDDAPELQSA